MVSPCQKPSASYFSISSAESRVRIVFMVAKIVRATRQFNEIPARSISGASLLGGRVPLQDARPAVLPLVLVHFGGLGVELRGHQAQTLSACKIEAASRDVQAVFGLAAQKLWGHHQLVYFFF